MTPAVESVNDDAAYFQPAAERTTQSFLDALEKSGARPLETLSPQAARAVLEQAQSAAVVPLPPADVTEKTIATDYGAVRLVVVRPSQVAGTPPAFMFFHGGGWVLGDFPTHERFVRDLVSQSGAAAVFVEYERSPEAHYPLAFEQANAATQWVAEHGKEIGVDGKRLGVVGNSAGGNLATAVALRGALLGGPPLRHQLLFWPVTDSRFDTESYELFQSGYFLTRAMMQWFWDNYANDESARNGIFASPLRAVGEQLRGLPPTLIVTAELDVLRDEGEAYARKLDAAGVEVVSLRVNGMIHDFGLLNALSGVPSVRAALRQAADEIRRRLA